MSALWVVSLVPSSTETLLAVGADVVACTRFCEQPHLLHVGGTKNPDIDAIVALEPDVVVVDREENRLEDHDDLIRRGVRVFVSDVRSVDDAIAVVGDLCDVAGVEPPPSFGANPSIEPLTVTRSAFVPIWRRPWMTIGRATYGASLLRCLGIDVVGAGGDTAYPVVELDQVGSPDLVLVPSEPYEFAAAHLDELRRSLPESRIVRVDGQDLFWWGIRTPGALRRLARALEVSGPVGGDDLPAPGE